MDIESFMLNNQEILLYLLIKKSTEFPYQKKQNLEELIKLVFAVDLGICRLLTIEHIKHNMYHALEILSRFPQKPFSYRAR